MRGPEGAVRREWVSGAARQAVAAVAPEELVLFEPLAAEFATRGELRPDDRYSDGMIESGWDAVVALVTPVALTLAKSLYNRLADNVSDEILKRGGRGLGRAWRRLRRPRHTAGGRAVQPPPQDAPDGSDRLREDLLRRARELGVPEGKAEPLVDALLAAVAGDVSAADPAEGA